MDVLPLLIIISLIVVGLVVWLFFRMSAGGQFDDLESPAQRILLDDDAGLRGDTERIEPAGRGYAHGTGQPPEAKD